MMGAEKKGHMKEQFLKKISKTFRAELGENNESPDKGRLGFEHH